jgi:hypothetical protein
MQALGTLGKWLLFFGIGSLVLDLLSMEFIILMWINFWGPEVAWTIRISMIVVGGLLWMISRFAPAPVVEDDESEPSPADGVA